MHSTTILNERGDTTLAWSQDRDAEMAEIIAKKMKAGVTFFIIEDEGARRQLEASTAKKILKEVGERRRLAIADADFAAFVAAGKGVEVATPKAPMRKTRVSRNAAEIAGSNSVAVRQMQGG